MIVPLFEILVYKNYILNATKNNKNVKIDALYRK